MQPEVRDQMVEWYLSTEWGLMLPIYLDTLCLISCKLLQFITFLKQV